MSTRIADRRWLRIAVPGFFLAVSSVTAWAQEVSEDTVEADETVVLMTDSVITPAAQAVLDRMTNTLNSLQRYEVTANITRDEVLSFGYKLQNNESARMLVERPNRMRVEVDGDIKHRTYVYDGSKVTMFDPDLNVYSTTAAPGTLGELAGVLLDAGVEMPLIDMLYHGATGNLTEDVRVGIVVGESEVDGVLTDHLAFRQPDVDWQLWVTKGGAEALPRKLLITTRYEVGDPQYQAILRWDLKARTHAKSFEFAPPAGATEIPALTKLVADGGDE